MTMKSAMAAAALASLAVGVRTHAEDVTLMDVRVVRVAPHGVPAAVWILTDHSGSQCTGWLRFRPWAGTTEAGQAANLQGVLSAFITGLHTGALFIITANASPDPVNCEISSVQMLPPAGGSEMLMSSAGGGMGSLSASAELDRIKPIPPLPD